MIVPINAIDVLIGGESVGIILNYDGVCITGFYKIKVDNEIIDPSNYFEINDIITSVDKKNVKTIDDLTNIIKNCNTSNLEFTIKRASNIYHKTMKIYKNNANNSNLCYNIVKFKIRGGNTDEKFFKLAYCHVCLYVLGISTSRNCFSFHGKEFHVYTY